MKRSVLILSMMLGLFVNYLFAGHGRLRGMGYSARSSETAGVWQDEVRSALFDLLMLDHILHERKNIPLNPEEISSEDKGEFLLKEMEIQSTRDRRVRVLVTVPKHTAAPWPAVVCIHGHGGKLHSVYEKTLLDGTPPITMSERFERAGIPVLCSNCKGGIQRD